MPDPDRSPRAMGVHTLRGANRTPPANPAVQDPNDGTTISDAAQSFRSPTSVTSDSPCPSAGGGFGKGSAGLTEARASRSAPPSMEQFEDLYRREFRSIVGSVYAFSGSPAAEDLTQEAFLEAARNWKDVGALERPGAWVRLVALRKANRHRQRRTRETRILTEEFPGVDTSVSFAELPAERAEFWQVVRELPRRQAQCLVLHYQAGYTVAEIADILAISAGTIKNYLHHGRRNLAKQLGLDAEHGERHEH